MECGSAGGPGQTRCPAGREIVRAGKLSENKALQGFPGGTGGHRRFVSSLGMYGGAYTCRPYFARQRVCLPRDTTDWRVSRGSGESRHHGGGGGGRFSILNPFLSGKRARWG